MTTNAPSAAPVVTRAAIARKLHLIWQNPESRQFIRVGSLSELVDGNYVFQYTEDALTAEGFYPLTQFPDRDKTYVSRALPAFFVNRLMSRKRESYPDYLYSLGIDSAQLDTPMELLARTGAPRETDTFHLVDDFAEDAEGVITTRFLASGIRHIPGASDRLAKVEPGQALILEPEPENPANPGALLICVHAHEPVGYVPDWLLTDVKGLRDDSREFTVIAERVNRDAHPHLRLLCRIEARRRGT